MQSNDNDVVVCSLAYVSKALVDFDDYRLERLVAKASLRNSECDVTGYLCYFGNCFIQFIEGPSESLQSVIDFIRRDDRHQIIKTIEFPSSNHRHFPDWSMRLVGASAVTEIQLEHILLELLKGVTRQSQDDQNLKSMMLRIIDKIAAHKSRLNLT